MAAEIPPTLKLITSALRRAEELEKDPNNESKIVAYYCRYYVVSKGSKLCSVPAIAAETKFLIEEMGKLEKFKATSEPLTSEKGHGICKSYALSVFEKADDEDRAGAADKATAKLFYAAGTFFDILEQFGDIPPEIVEKRKYAKWKATEILNSIKNGVKPTPGGYGEGVADLHLSGGDESGLDIPPAPRPVIPSAPSASAPQYVSSPHSGSSAPSPVPAPFKAYVPQPTSHAPPVVVTSNLSQLYAQSPPPSFVRPPINNTDPRVQDTVELCNFAILALKKNEIALARERLKEALRRLE
mmetsp:Transcript_33176/g.56765  ORF Transcript_33176/g.56765 Transcript_33176/m.56765 type:complete len:299 (-) Transcript_33176:101-997(-)